MDDSALASDRHIGLLKTARLVASAGSGALLLLSLWLFFIDPDHPWRTGTIAILILQAIAILAFLGGIRWALAFADVDGSGRRDLVLSAVPVAIAPAMFFISTPAVFGALAAAFAALGAWDSLAAHSSIAPAWYGRLRIQLTAVIVVALVLAFVATS